MARSNDETSRLGVLAVGTIFTGLRWAYREQPTSDFGIDAQAEKLDENGVATGKLIALQIKSGASWFRKRGEDFVYYGEPRHRDYWTSHALPVFIVIHDPDAGLTLWQRVERHLIEHGKDGRWSIPIPASNTLDAAHEPFILAGIAADAGSVRRYRLALDMPLIRRVADEACTYIRIQEWVNKTLNFRSTDFVFADDPEADVDLTAATWLPATALDQFMGHTFPWLSYEYVSYNDEAGAGELAIHTLEVELSQIGRAAVLLEDFYQEGPVEPDEPTATPVSQAWIGSMDDVGDLDRTRTGAPCRGSSPSSCEVDETWSSGPHPAGHGGGSQ